MSIQSINSNLPKLKIPSLFEPPQKIERTPNPLRFTTESSLEETNKANSRKNDVEKKQKNFRTSENWYG